MSLLDLVRARSMHVRSRAVGDDVMATWLASVLSMIR